MIHLFAIQHKPSGSFLPTKWKQRRGFTHSEPSDGMPRLFPSERSAEMALDAWLKGVWVRSDYQSGSGECVEDITIKPRPDRKREHMRIVRVTLEWET